MSITYVDSLLGIAFSDKRYITDRVIATLPEMAKHKFASISLTMRDRAISSEFLIHRESEKCTLGNFQKIFLSPKMAAILYFRIFAKNGKTQICFCLLNRAR